MIHGSSEDPFVRLKQTHEKYKVFDAHYESLGKVDDLFVDDLDQLSYMGLKVGLLGTKFILVPVEIIRVNDKREVVEVAETKEKIEHAPTFEASEEITPELEDRTRRYFGLSSLLSPSEQELYGTASQSRATGEELASDARVDMVPGERAETTERLGRAREYDERNELRERSVEHETAETRIEATDASNERERDPANPRPQSSGHGEAHAPRVRSIQR